MEPVLAVAIGLLGLGEGLFPGAQAIALLAQEPLDLVAHDAAAILEKAILPQTSDIAAAARDLLAY